MTARSVATGLMTALILGLGALVAVPAQAEFDEGIEYSRVLEPERAEPGTDIEVLELFWYGCPHCYELEPALAQWRKTAPAGVTFRRMPAAASPRWVPHAKAYYAAEQLGVLDKLHDPLFKALHVERRPVLTDEQIIDFAAEQGIDKEAFRAAYNSFPVDMQVRRAGDLVTRYKIDGVPAMVVDGRFVTSATQAGGRDKMFEVINYLVAQEAAAAKPAAKPEAAPAGATPAAAPAPAKPAGS